VTEGGRFDRQRAGWRRGAFRTVETLDQDAVSRSAVLAPARQDDGPGRGEIADRLSTVGPRRNARAGGVKRRMLKRE
jgi:hypothetical protein